MRSNTGRHRKLGFTLIELLVVILILAVLAAMIVPRLVTRGEDAKVAAAKTNLAQIRGMLEAFRIDCGRYPTTDEGLEALTVQPADLDNWKGPYPQKPIEPDPWGNEYIYDNVGAADGEDAYVLMSYGKDGAEGGEGPNADIIESGG